MSLRSHIQSPAPARGGLTVREDSPLVLVVDDHVINRMILQRQLSVLAYPSDAVEHGMAALHAMQTRRYRLLITDCDMPVMNGYALSRRVRSVEGARGQPRIPIIAFTASDIASDQQKCLDAGMDDRLEKPVSLDELQNTMRRWLPQAGSELPMRVPTNDPRGAAGAGLQPINLDALRRITGDDSAAIQRALQHFWRVNAVDVAALVQAIDRADFPAAVREAHRIKGASRLVGAERLANVCADIEAAEKNFDRPTFSALSERFHTELKCLEDYFAAA